MLTEVQGAGYELSNHFLKCLLHLRESHDHTIRIMIKEMILMQTIPCTCSNV